MMHWSVCPRLRRAEGQDRTEWHYTNTSGLFLLLWAALLGPQYLLASLLLQPSFQLSCSQGWTQSKLSPQRRVQWCLWNTFNKNNHQWFVLLCFGWETQMDICTPTWEMPSLIWVRFCHPKGSSSQKEMQSSTCLIMSRWTIYLTCHIPWEFHMMELSCGRAFLRQLLN